jgi:hypothetical protein
MPAAQEIGSRQHRAHIVANTLRHDENSATSKVEIDDIRFGDGWLKSAARVRLP